MKRSHVIASEARRSMPFGLHGSPRFARDDENLVHVHLQFRPPEAGHSQ